MKLQSTPPKKCSDGFGYKHMEPEVPKPATHFSYASTSWVPHKADLSLMYHNSAADATYIQQQLPPHSLKRDATATTVTCGVSLVAIHN